MWPREVEGSCDRRGAAPKLEAARFADRQAALQLHRLQRPAGGGETIDEDTARLAAQLVLREIHRREAEAERIEPGMIVARDDRDAAYEAVTHLVRLGYKRIGIINGLASVSSTRQRRAGYKKALKDGGRSFVPALAVHGDFRVESGYRGGLDILKHKPDAVFITNYLMAVGFMRALRQYQLRCPEDVAIVTCDDHPWLDSFGVGLTTVNFPKYELGCESCRVLIDRLAQPGRPLQAVELKSGLTIRESCGFQIRRSTPAIA